jgi:hypothetical protein
MSDCDCKKCSATEICKPKEIKCKYCGELTPFRGTNECDRCWELSSRIEREPELAKKIFDELGQNKT